MIATQPDLFDNLPDPEPWAPWVEPEDAELSIQERFQAFHEANPWVCRMLVKMTRELIEKGHKRVGMKMLFECLRWQYMRQTVDPNSSFLLNNSFSSRYSRLVQEQEPDLAGVFEVRTLKA